jgi:hypothetical protein
MRPRSIVTAVLAQERLENHVLAVIARETGARPVIVDPTGWRGNRTVIDVLDNEMNLTGDRVAPGSSRLPTRTTPSARRSDTLIAECAGPSMAASRSSAEQPLNQGTPFSSITTAGSSESDMRALYTAQCEIARRQVDPCVRKIVVASTAERHSPSVRS